MSILIILLYPVLSISQEVNRGINSKSNQITRNFTIEKIQGRHISFDYFCYLHYKKAIVWCSMTHSGSGPDWGHKTWVKRQCQQESPLPGQVWTVIGSWQRVDIEWNKCISRLDSDPSRAYANAKADCYQRNIRRACDMVYWLKLEYGFN